MEEADFSGYATKNGLKCTDGRVIHAEAFKDDNGQRVPLVWQHQHDGPVNVLGYGILEHRDDGTYVYGFFNDTDAGQNTKRLVKHGDIRALSIYANKLKQIGSNVMHGAIREVSLVLTGANPGAFIDNVNLAHSSDNIGEDAIIYTGLSFEHSDADEDTTEIDNEEGASVAELSIQDVLETLNEDQQAVVHYMLDEALNGSTDDEDEDYDEDEAVQHAESDTVQDVFDTLDEEQKQVVYYMIAEALDGGDSTDSNDSNIQHSQEGSTMSNVFDQNNTIAHKANHLNIDQIQTIMRDGQKSGSLKESFLAHADEYGITNIDLMFPDARATSSTPELIARQAEWVPKVLGATKHAPFAKIKSLVADLTAEEARAKGYIKGTMKKEEVIRLLRRTTGPTTIYKKQKLDRDDILDITDFDVITWLKWEIRFMLNEELARAILIGDGRSSINADKIKDPEGAVDGVGIRSIANDNELYAHQVQLAANVSAAVIIDEVARSRSAYRGSGNPTFYTTDKIITDLLLLKDKMSRRLYDTEAALAAALRVKEIVAVEVLEETPEILGIMVNLIDYTVGANKGGELSFFEDFDIDFNQNKFLLETRVSGALTKPKSAVVIRRSLGTLATATAPSFNGTTDTITVPVVTGVDYLINDIVVTGNVIITEATEVVSAAKAEFYLEPNTTNSWTFTV